jgi:hypothetical protein
VCKRKLSNALDFITDPNTPAAKNTFVGISSEKRGGVVRRKRDPVPGIDRLLHSIFIDQGLKVAFSLLFTARADHGVIEKNQLQLALSRFKDLRGAGKDFHPLSCRSEARGQELGLSLLFDDAKTASPKGNEPAIMAEGRNSYPRLLGSFENCSPSLNFYLCAINLKLDYVRHCTFFCHAKP